MLSIAKHGKLKTITPATYEHKVQNNTQNINNLVTSQGDLESASLTCQSVECIITSQKEA